MSNPLFDDLSCRLLSQGIPAPEVARYLGELHDHRADLAAELLAQGADPQTAEKLALERLGTPQCLAHAAVSARQRQFISARNPWLFFALLPALLTPVLTALMVLIPLLCFVLLADLIGRPFQHISGTWVFVFVWGSAFMNYFWPGLMALYIYRAAWRRGLGWTWRLAAVAIVLFWGTWLHCLTLPGDASQQGRFSLGLHFSISKIVAGLLIFTAYMCWRQHRTRKALNKPYSAPAGS